MSDKQDVLRVVEMNGPYVAVRDLSPDDVIEAAKKILRARFQRGKKLDCSADAKDYVILTLGDRDHEAFACLFLDTRHRVIRCDLMATGSLAEARVYPREVVKRALLYNAAAVIFAHNHPSGVAEPSKGDKALTDRLASALQLIDVQVLDHLVVGGDETVSFADRGML